jgi:tetratricopeptide (TPR) repeat protein
MTARLAVLAFVTACVVLVTADRLVAAPSLEEEYGGAVVLIQVFPKSPAETSIPMGFGTGWLASYDGFVITANHVVTAYGDIAWGEATLEGRVRGKSFPLDFVKQLEGDLALLKFRWDQRADTIFERLREEPPRTMTTVRVLGFPSASQHLPSVLTHSVSYTQDRLRGEGRLPHGMSGAPVVFVGDTYIDVVAMALAIIRNAQLTEVEAEYLAAGAMQRAVDEMRSRRAVLSRPRPTWLPVTGRPRLFRDAEIRDIIDVLGLDGVALVSGAPGMEVAEFGIQVGDRAWELFNLRSSHLLYLDAADLDLSKVLSHLVVRLQRDNLVSADDQIKIQAIREELAKPELRVLIVNNVASEEIVRTILDVRGSTPTVITSPQTFDMPAPVVTRALRGLSHERCGELIRVELGGQRSLTANDLSAVCWLLDGMPLAARLFAGAIRDGVPFGDLFKVIRDRPTDLIQDKLQALYERVVKQLPAQHQQVILSLSVLGNGSFDRAAADAVAGRPTSVFFPRLLRANLMEATAGDRFRIPSITRAHLLERLRTAPEESSRARRAMVTHYLRDRLDLAAFRRERPHVEMAVRMAPAVLGSGEGCQWVVNTVPRVAASLRSLGQWADHKVLAQCWLGCVGVADVDGRLDALRALAEGALDQGRDAEARELVDQAHRLPNVDENPKAAWIYNVLAQLEIEPVNPDQRPDPVRLARARDYAEKALAIAAKAPRGRVRAEMEAIGFRRRGFIYQLEEKVEEARGAFRKSFEIAEQSNLQQERVRTRFQLAVFETSVKAWDEASRGLQIVIKEAAGIDEHARVSALYMLAYVANSQGNLRAAEQYLVDAVNGFQALGARQLPEAKKDLENVRAEIKRTVAGATRSQPRRD